jgi:hypothetical protein
MCIFTMTLHICRGATDSPEIKNMKRTLCSETTLPGESRFHISTPLEIEPGPLMRGSEQVDHWISGTVYECSEIAGSLQLPCNLCCILIECGASDSTK